MIQLSPYTIELCTYTLHSTQSIYTRILQGVYRYYCFNMYACVLQAIIYLLLSSYGMMDLMKL